MTPPNEVVWAGIDTHTDTHTIALLDERGRPLGAETFTADPDGYDRLCVCSIESGPCERVESLQMSGRF